MRTAVMMVVLILSLLVVACGSGDDTAANQTQPRIEGFQTLEILTETPPPATPTDTPTPTPIPQLTLPPTPQQVTVTRLNDTVDPTINRLLEAGRNVPDITLTDINGIDYHLPSLAGRAVIINFWTVGCGSCFYEFPLLQQLHEDIPDDELLIMAVNVSPFSDETRIIADGMGITYPMLSDPLGEVFDAYFGGAVIPTTYFIAPDNTVHDVVVGPMDLAGFQSRIEAMQNP